MKTRVSPMKSKRGEDSEKQSSFRWCKTTRLSLLNFLAENTQLYTISSVSKKVKYTRILNELDLVDFPTKANMKWEAVENRMEWLVKAYCVQSMRFQKTREGPRAAEIAAGAENLICTDAFYVWLTVEAVNITF